MIYLPPNTFSIICRGVAILILLFAEYCIVGNAIIAYDSSSANPSRSMIVGSLIILFLIIMLIFSVLDVIKLEGDTLAKQITVSTLLRKKTFLTSEIAGYNMSVYEGRALSKYGRIIVMKNGKELELFYGNITYIDSIDQFMTDLSIPYLGEKKTNYPFSTMFNRAV